MGTDRLDKRFLTHGLHNPAGPENGDPALDSQDRVEGLLRGFYACRNRYCDRYQAKLSGFLQKGVDSVPDHLTRHRIDRCSAYWLVQTGFCDATDADAAVDSDKRLRKCLFLMSGIRFFLLFLVFWTQTRFFSCSSEPGTFQM